MTDDEAAYHEAELKICRMKKWTYEEYLAWKAGPDCPSPERVDEFKKWFDTLDAAIQAWKLRTKEENINLMKTASKSYVMQEMRYHIVDAAINEYKGNEIFPKITIAVWICPFDHQLDGTIVWGRKYVSDFRLLPFLLVHAQRVEDFAEVLALGSEIEEFPSLRREEPNRLHGGIGWPQGYKKRG